MPGLVNPPPRLATINFVKRDISPQDQDKYLSRYDANDLPPKDTVNVPLHDLRNEFDALPSAREQLDERG